MGTMKYKLIVFAIVTGCLTFIAEAVMMYATNWTIGVSPDSIIYIKVARNIISGQGLTIAPGEPLTHYPPLYPAFLSIPGMVGFDALDGARWLHVFLFAVNVLLVGAIIYRQTNGSITAQIFGTLFMLSSLSMLDVHTMAWSEALFVMLVLGGLFALAEHLSYPENSTLLVTSALFIGAACLTRYIGIAVVVSASLSILLLRNSDWRQNFKYASIYGLIGGLPMIFWLFRNRLMAGNLTDRVMKYHPIDLKRIFQGTSTVAEWLLLPENLSLPAKNSFIILLIFLLVSGSVLVFFKQKRNVHTMPAARISYFPIISIIVVAGYVLLVIVSISFFDAHTPLDNRLLSPLFPLGIILFFTLVTNVASRLRMILLHFLLVLILAGLLAYQVKTTLPYWHYTHENGRWYTGKDWQTSNILKIVRSLPEDIVLYSNGNEALEFLTGKEVSAIAPMEAPGSGLKNEDLEPELLRMQETLASSNGLLVYFNLIDWRWYLPTSDFLAQKLPLQVRYKGADGIIYQVRKN